MARSKRRSARLFKSSYTTRSTRSCKSSHAVRSIHLSKSSVNVRSARSSKTSHAVRSIRSSKSSVTVRPFGPKTSSFGAGFNNDGLSQKQAATTPRFSERSMIAKIPLPPTFSASMRQLQVLSRAEARYTIEPLIYGSSSPRLQPQVRKARRNKIPYPAACSAPTGCLIMRRQSTTSASLNQANQNTSC